MLVRVFFPSPLGLGFGLAFALPLPLPFARASSFSFSVSFSFVVNQRRLTSADEDAVELVVAEDSASEWTAILGALGEGGAKFSMWRPKDPLAIGASCVSIGELGRSGKFSMICANRIISSGGAISEVVAGGVGSASGVPGAVLLVVVVSGTPVLGVVVGGAAGGATVGVAVGRAIVGVAVGRVGLASDVPKIVFFCFNVYHCRE